MSNDKEKLLAKWEFDNYRDQRGEVEVVDNPADTEDWHWRLNVHSGEKTLRVDTFRDQWGTYITFRMGEESLTIAQEDGTRSFVDALTAALGKFRNITDIETKPPTEIKPAESVA